MAAILRSAVSSARFCNQEKVPKFQTSALRNSCAQMPSGRVWRSTRFIPSPSRHSIPRRSLSRTQVSPRCHTPPRSPQSPRIQRELRDLIRRMSKENPLWGAPRIHGELLKLGFEIDRVDGLQVHDPAPRTAVTELADIPAQSCRRNRSDRHG